MRLTNDDINKIAYSIEPVIINRTMSTKTENQNVHDRVERIANAIEDIDDKAFDFSKFSISEKTLFIRSLFDILDHSMPVLRRYFTNEDTSKKKPNCKLLYNLSKADADICLDQFIKGLFQRNEDNHISVLSNGNSSYVNNYNYSRFESNSFRDGAQSDIRYQIRHLGNYEDTYQGYMASYMAEISRHNDWKINEGMYNPVEFIYVIDAYIDIFAYLFLQAINYCIIKSENISYVEKEKVLDNLYAQAQDNRLNFKEGTKQEILWSFAIYIFFLTRRNNFLTELRVQSLLTKQMEEPDYIKQVPEEYRCKYSNINEVTTKKQLRKIILEGKEEKEERFNERFAEMQKLIDILRITAGRDLESNHLQHAKVVYREVVEDGLQFEVAPGKRRNANTIARLINKPETPLYEELSSTIFLREKISRGFFREEGFADLYIKKNRIQKCIYEDILSAFNGYDEIQIAKNLRKVYTKYNKLLKMEYFDKH